MKTKYVGKNVNIRDNFKDTTQEKIDRLDKYFNEDVEATVTMSTEGASDKRVEITIFIPGTDTILRADQTSYDMLDSVDLCVNALVSQVRKYRTKLKKSQKNRDSIRFAAFEAEEEEEELSPISRVKELQLRPMSPEEAVLQMELTDHDFYLFYNPNSDSVDLVYRRKKGDYGRLTTDIGYHNE